VLFKIKKLEKLIP